MHRRELLTLCGGGLVGIAGCTSRQRDGRQTTTGPGATPPTSPGTTTRTATAADTELAVELDALQSALVLLNVDYLDVPSEPSSQYLYLHVSAPEESAPSLADLSFRFDGASHDPLGVDQLPSVYRRTTRESAPHYEAGRGSGWTLFELPTNGDASDAAFVWPGGEWHPDESLRTRLAASPPPLSLEQWHVPETPTPGERTTFRVAAKNSGDVPGRFVGGINADGWYPHRPITQLSRRIPAGEAVTWEVPGERIELVSAGMADRMGDGDADLNYELVTPGASRSASVRVVDE